MTTREYSVAIGPLCMVVYPDEKNQGFYGHCLSTDSIAHGTTAKEAAENLKRVLEDEIFFHMENSNLPALFKNPASQEEWDKHKKGCDASALEYMKHISIEETEVYSQLAKIGKILLESQERSLAAR